MSLQASSIYWEVGQTYTVTHESLTNPWSGGVGDYTLLWGSSHVLWDLPALNLAIDSVINNFTDIFGNIYPSSYDGSQFDEYCTIQSARQLPSGQLEYTILVTAPIPVGGIYLGYGFFYATDDGTSLLPCGTLLIHPPEEENGGGTVFAPLESIAPTPFEESRPNNYVPDFQWSWSDGTWNYHVDLVAIGGGRYNIKTIAFGKDGGDGVIYLGD